MEQFDYSLLAQNFEPNEPEPAGGTGIRLKKAVAKSRGGMVTDKVQSQPDSALPNSVDAYRTRAADLYKQGEALYNAEPDTSGIQAFARQQGESGNAAMLNALAAQFAGESFQPVQAQFLKRAAAAREPMKFGGGILTPDGQFIKDPEVTQNKKAEFLLAQAKQYEQMAQTADTARERIAAQRAQNEIQNQLRMMGLQMQQQGLAMRAESAAATRALAESNANNKRDRQIETDVQTLAKRGEDLTNLTSGVRQLNERLSPYFKDGQAQSIPGIGYGSDLNVLGIDVGGLAAGEAGRANRSAVKNVANELLRLASGQAVTLNEYQRQLLANMASGSYSERDFLNAYENVILPKVNEAVANLGGGFSAEAKQRYGQQGGKIDFSRPFESPRSKPAADAGKGNLSAQEQAELEALRKRFGGK